MIVPKVTDEQIERARKALLYDEAIERAKKLFQPPPNKQKTKRYKNIQRTETKKR